MFCCSDRWQQLLLGFGRPPCIALPCTLVMNDSLGQQGHSVLCRTRTSWQVIKLMFLMWKIAVTCPVVLPSLRFGTENGRAVGEGSTFIFCTPRLGRKSWQRNPPNKNHFPALPQGLPEQSLPPSPLPPAPLTSLLFGMYWCLTNPLQCSCLENPRDGGAWWAAVYGLHRVGHD